MSAGRSVHAFHRQIPGGNTRSCGRACLPPSGAIPQERRRPAPIAHLRPMAARCGRLSRWSGRPARHSPVVSEARHPVVIHHTRRGVCPRSRQRRDLYRRPRGAAPGRIFPEFTAPVMARWGGCSRQLIRSGVVLVQLGNAVRINKPQVRTNCAAWNVGTAMYPWEIE